MWLSVQRDAGMVSTEAERRSLWFPWQYRMTGGEREAPADRGILNEAHDVA
jgi:hypothetical protein